MRQGGVGARETGEHAGELALPLLVVGTVRPELVTVPSEDFSTTTWRSAYAATCGRWVTTSTWALRASWASRRRPRRPPPPTPASTSSKTKVGTGLVPARATSRASITRDSSRPTRPRQRPGLGSSVGREEQLHLVDPGRGVAQPPAVDQERPAVGVGRLVDLGLPHLDGQAGVRHGEQRQLGGHLRGQPVGSCAAGRRQGRGSGTEVLAELGPLGPEPSIRSSVWSRSRSRAADRCDQASTSSIVSPYLRVSAVSSARRCDTWASRAGSVSTRAA